MQIKDLEDENEKIKQKNHYLYTHVEKIMKELN
jgi:hypothetical protein